MKTVQMIIEEAQHFKGPTRYLRPGYYKKMRRLEDKIRSHSDKLSDKGMKHWNDANVEGSKGNTFDTAFIRAKDKKTAKAYERLSNMQHHKAQRIRDKASKLFDRGQNWHDAMHARPEGRKIGRFMKGKKK